MNLKIKMRPLNLINFSFIVLLCCSFVKSQLFNSSDFTNHLPVNNSSAENDNDIDAFSDFILPLCLAAIKTIQDFIGIRLQTEMKFTEKYWKIRNKYAFPNFTEYHSNNLNKEPLGSIDELTSKVTLDSMPSISSESGLKFLFPLMTNVAPGKKPIQTVIEEVKPFLPKNRNSSSENVHPMSANYYEVLPEITSTNSSQNSTEQRFNQKRTLKHKPHVHSTKHTKYHNHSIPLHHNHTEIPKPINETITNEPVPVRRLTSYLFELIDRLVTWTVIIPGEVIEQVALRLTFNFLGDIRMILDMLRSLLASDEAICRHKLFCQFTSFFTMHTPNFIKNLIPTAHEEYYVAIVEAANKNEYLNAFLTGLMGFRCNDIYEHPHCKS